MMCRFVFRENGIEHCNLQNLCDTDEKVEQTCQEVTEAADEVKEGFTQVSNMTKDVKGKLSEGKQGLVKRARENVVDVAAQKTKDKVVKELKK
ncbi:hypothetical protein Tco_1578757 [Tanacetum coccineum]